MRLRSSNHRWRLFAYSMACAVLFIVASNSSTSASQGGLPAIVSLANGASRQIILNIGRSVVIDLPDDATDVLVADPSIANAVVRTAKRVFVIGGKIGETNIVFFGANGRQIAALNVVVQRDLNGLRTELRKYLPHASIQIDGLGDKAVILTGTATTPAEAQKAFDIASKFVGNASQVINQIDVRGRDQVMLKVVVAEVARDVVKQLGIDLSGSVSYGSAVVNLNTSNAFSASGQAIDNTSFAGTFKNVTATLKAMERAGVVRTLAEPNLTAISGETASFLAGGEFPIPNGLSCDTTKSPPVCQAQVEFKKFGVSLMFTPVVLSEGRISLKVLTEVSDLSNKNSMTLSVTGSDSNLTIPSIQTRRTDTVVEIPSGGSLAIAGMIQETTKQSADGIPGLMHLPVLGALFKSRDYINNRTELVIFVTPYIVHAVAPSKLSRPDDGYEDASDPAAVLLGQFNKIYGGRNGADAAGQKYYGSIGFITD